MIDFNNASFFKLNMVGNDAFHSQVAPILVADEAILSTYKGIRDGVVFTNKRIIAINVQGLTGAKKDYTSLPYSKIQAYSVETAGTAEKLFSFTADCELELYFSSIGKVKFEFTGATDILEIGRVISEYVL